MRNQTDSTNGRKEHGKTKRVPGAIFSILQNVKCKDLTPVLAFFPAVGVAGIKQLLGVKEG